MKWKTTNRQKMSEGRWRNKHWNTYADFVAYIHVMWFGGELWHWYQCGPDSKQLSPSDSNAFMQYLRNHFRRYIMLYIEMFEAHKMQTHCSENTFTGLLSMLSDGLNFKKCDGQCQLYQTITNAIAMLVMFTSTTSIQELRSATKLLQ